MAGGACGPRFHVLVLLGVLLGAPLRAGTWLRAAKPVPRRVRSVRARGEGRRVLYDTASLWQARSPSVPTPGAVMPHARRPAGRLGNRRPVRAHWADTFSLI